jgi:hypothetical protein
MKQQKMLCFCSEPTQAFAPWEPQYALFTCLGTMLTYVVIAYPPPDNEKVREYLLQSHDTKLESLCHWIAFLCALFEVAASKVSLLKRENCTLPQAWHEYLAQGGTEFTYGSNHTTFYNLVLIMLKKYVKLTLSVSIMEVLMSSSWCQTKT